MEPSIEGLYKFAKSKPPLEEFMFSDPLTCGVQQYYASLNKQLPRRDDQCSEFEKKLVSYARHGAYFKYSSHLPIAYNNWGNVVWNIISDYKNGIREDNINNQINKLKELCVETAGDALSFESEDAIREGDDVG